VAFDFDIAQALLQAVAAGAKVINISLGGDSAGVVLRDAILTAIDAGVMVVASAGNNGSTTPSFPAGFDFSGLLGVGGVDTNNLRAAGSNFGPWVDISAPWQVATTWPLGIPVGGDPNVEYVVASGTSFSAPIAAGIAAMILSSRPDLGAQGVEELLLASAQVFSALNGVNKASGVVNAQSALSQSGTFTPSSASVVPSSGSSSGGCTLAPAAAFGLEWLLLAAGLFLRGQRSRRVK
jgi:subtilisin family serine protease